MKYTNKIKLVAFDLDGTIVKEDSSWGRIHQFFGSMDVQRINLELYLRNKITYDEFMRRDIAAWPKPLHVNQIKSILLNYELDENMYFVVKELTTLGVEIAIISAGIDILANDVAKKLGIKHVVANGLEINEKGYLTGNGIKRVEPLRKHEVLSKLANKLGITLKNTAAVGDSKYDKTFLLHAGVGIALDKDPELTSIADFVVKSVKEVPRIIKKINLL